MFEFQLKMQNCTGSKFMLKKILYLEKWPSKTFWYWAESEWWVISAPLSFPLFYHFFKNKQACVLKWRLMTKTITLSCVRQYLTSLHTSSYLIPTTNKWFHLTLHLLNVSWPYLVFLFFIFSNRLLLPQSAGFRASGLSHPAAMWDLSSSSRLGIESTSTTLEGRFLILDHQWSPLKGDFIIAKFTRWGKGLPG